jgi:predicted  nucleic acid-binding Zn-ribbon protein
MAVSNTGKSHVATQSQAASPETKAVDSLVKSSQRIKDLKEQIKSLSTDVASIRIAADSSVGILNYWEQDRGGGTPALMAALVRQHAELNAQVEAGEQHIREVQRSLQQLLEE